MLSIVNIPVPYLLLINYLQATKMLTPVPQLIQALHDVVTRIRHSYAPMHCIFLRNARDSGQILKDGETSEFTMHKK